MKHLLFRLKLMILYPVGVAGALYYLLIRSWGGGHAVWLRQMMPRFIGRSLLWLHGISIQVIHGENLPARGDGGAVIFANHNSRLDPYVLLATLPFPFKSFWSTRAHITTEGFDVARWFGRVFDLFYVHDKKQPRNTAREFVRATRYVSEGGVLSFFPEGRISRDGEPGLFGVACSRLAIEAGAPIIPVLIFGTPEFFERPSRDAARRVSVMVCPKVSTSEYSPKQAARLSAEVESAMRRFHHEYGARVAPGAAPVAEARSSARSGRPEAESLLAGSRSRRPQ